MFNISIDKSNELVEAKLGGLMSTTEVAAYIDELRRQFIANSLRSYVMIIDVSDMPIQTQEMVKAMGEHMGGMPKARAIAVVTGSSLAKMQVRRLFTQDYARVVATMIEARAWVLAGVEPAG